MWYSTRFLGRQRLYNMILDCSRLYTVSNKASKALKPLAGEVALVTGGARGVGRGIALQLGEAGAVVYVTGRPPNENPRKPTLKDTVDEITDKGGKAVAVYCDHSKDEEVKELFKRIAKDENNKLNLLVNNAYSGGSAIAENGGKKFFECDLSLWDEINNVGLRNVYHCCVLASRMMVPRRKGLIVNISSSAGIRYFFNVPYGVGKAAIDRMSADMAEELKEQGVAVLSLWPGVVKTEQSYEWLRSGKLSQLTGMPQAQLERMMIKGESPAFVGRAVMYLAFDKGVIKKTGRILLTADLCHEYTFIDNDGKIPSNMRSVSSVLDFFGFTSLAKVVPRFLKIPAIALHISSNKFHKL